MEALYIFNPDHDLALANGDENYVSPYQARKMAEDLFTLPAWYAPSGSLIRVPEGGNWEQFREKWEGFLVGIRGIVEKDFTYCSGVIPWGWNPGLVKWLKNSGIDKQKLLDRDQIQKIRSLSHRAVSIKLLQLLKEEEPFIAEAVYLKSLPEIMNFLEKELACVLKAPWSGSGRGLLWYKGNYDTLTDQWCKKVLRIQGGIIGTPLYNKIIDFAMEFYADGSGGVKFAGYSLFQTDAWGGYRGNLLATDEHIEKILTIYIERSKLLRLIRYLEMKLSSLLGKDYKGYLGVDMMVYRDVIKEKYELHPCVEINLRMSMGMVARLLYQQYIYPDSWGWFKIDYRTGKGTQLMSQKEQCHSMPLVRKEGKIYSGYCSLSPVNENTNYKAVIYVYSKTNR